MKKILKFIMLLAVSFVVAFILIVATLLMTSKIIFVDGKLYTLDESYTPGGICAAMTPACGVCVSYGGAVLREYKCYVRDISVN